MQLKDNMFQFEYSNSSFPLIKILTLSHLFIVHSITPCLQ